MAAESDYDRVHRVEFGPGGVQVYPPAPTPQPGPGPLTAADVSALTSKTIY